MKADVGLFSQRPGDGNGVVVDRAKDAPARRSGDPDRGHSSKFARDRGLTDVEVLENGSQSNRQTLAQCSKLPCEENDRQARVLAHAQHHMARLSEQNVRVPVAKDRR